MAALSTESEPLIKEELEDINGTYIITSSPSNMVSYFHTGEDYTYFTSELIDILKNGIDNNDPFIEVGEIYEYIKLNLKRKNQPLPMQKNTINASGKIYFANNYKYLDYSKKINEADVYLRTDEFDLALKTYNEIITEFNTYDNKNIELKIKSINLIHNAERIFEQNKYEIANKYLMSALEILESTNFNIGKVLNERKKIYSLTSLMESKLRKELEEHLIPLIRKDLEEKLIVDPQFVEQKLREKLEQEYKIKTVNIERELRQEISQEYKHAIIDKSNAKILLILSANPKDTVRIRIDEEIREINSTLKYNNNYQLLLSLATKASNIDQILLENIPEILHIITNNENNIDFNGNNLAEFVFEDEVGKTVLIGGQRLIEFLKIFPSIKLAILGGCYTSEVAYQLSEFIPYTIGFLNAVSDRMCIAFSRSFYKALVSKEDIEFAYNFAVMACKLRDFPDEKPILYKQESYKSKQNNESEKSDNFSSLLKNITKNSEEYQAIDAKKNTLNHGDVVDER